MGSAPRNVTETLRFPVQENVAAACEESQSCSVTAEEQVQAGGANGAVSVNRGDRGRGSEHGRRARRRAGRRDGGTGDRTRGKK